METRLGIPIDAGAGEKEENFDLFGSDEVCDVSGWEEG